MILHLCFDTIFIDEMIQLLNDAAPGQNVFVIFVPYENYEYKHIKQKNEVRPVVNSDETIRALLLELDQYDAVMFHSLNHHEFWKLLHYGDKAKKIKWVWPFWGGEYYDHYKNVKKYMGPLTWRTFYWNYPWKIIILKIKMIIKRIIGIEVFELEREAAKITHFVEGVQGNHNTIKETWNINAKILSGNFYATIEQMVGKALMDKWIVGNNILIGNSATGTSNHLEVFDILKNIDIDKRKIIVPLSYGSSIKSLRYENYIIKKGKKLWGNAFIPLLSFLPREEYFKILLDCGIVIMNHYRQQAGNNVIAALYLGAKVFMSKRSTLYQHLKNMGVVLFTVEDDLREENPAVFVPLTNDEKIRNRKILYDKYSYANILRETRLVVKELLEHSSDRFPDACKS